METNLEQRKEKAIELLQILNIYKPYIRRFKEANRVCFFEEYGGYYIDQEPELEQKVKEFEEKYGGLVYAITHEFTQFGECYDFLYVPNNNKDWDGLIDEYSPNKFYAFTYVWNKDDDWCSEFGSICVQSFGGGIKRIY